ncbi:MAG: N-6 DNA methylase [Alphaproteobacteria bacterium]|nr:N-6 DNA methylase [Alphaproteobacteria bacterium]
MEARAALDHDLEWLDHVQPVGLVVAPSLIKELGLVPEMQTSVDNAKVAEFVNDDPDLPALNEAWAFAEHILGWTPALVAGTPKGPNLPDDLAVVLPEHDTTLAPHWAVKAPGTDGGWQLLVRTEKPGIDPDARGALDGWEATAHQRFERLLRETDVEAGILFTDDHIRLIYAPKGETSGWIAFPLRPMATVAGRPMLGGLKLVLGGFRLFNAPSDQRLPALLSRSREAQAQVSTQLSEQVLGALHELLRGVKAAEPELIDGLAKHRPSHVYEGLLTVLMRLVFVLYAEDRDLIPSRNDATARDFYDQGYSVRNLYAKLLEDQARNPDTMDERLGAWGRLLSLFRLVHGGDRTGWISGRRGKLFDPDAFPFLEGRDETTSAPRTPRVTDGCVLRLLDGLLSLKGERLSYRTLDVEQIGSVYETVMGFTVESASGHALAIKAGKNNRTPVYVDLDDLTAAKAADRLKRLKEGAHRNQITAKNQKAIKAAKDRVELTAALDPMVDERASPGHRVLPPNTPILQPTDERRRTGSHYTPRSLTEPIVRHALEPAFERLGGDATPDQILELRVCDPAMGSGAFLVEACRALGTRLVQAWSRWPETRPKIPADEDEDLHARRLVAQRCIYGVDRNPMAVDLARLSLWLVTLARDHEFTFLDHAFKCGDSLVGLTRQQITSLNWDETQPGLPLFRNLVNERIEAALDGRREIQDAPDDVGRAVQEVRHKAVEQRLDNVRLLGDAVISAFFAAKKTRARETKRQEIENTVHGPTREVWPKLESFRDTLAVRPFHWQVEFPEVFARDNPGFDAIVGNPPFLGGKRISTANGEEYRDWLAELHPGNKNADLVAHFFRRGYSLIREKGRFGLIATNTIGQGDTRQIGLAAILRAGGAISHATRRLKWPGEAAVVVSVVHVQKGIVDQPFLDGGPVSRVSAYLVENDLDDDPAQQVANAGQAFQGSIVLGMGFTFDDKAAEKGESPSIADMERITANNPGNAERICPYIGGEEVNGNVRQQHRRHVIDVNDLDVTELEAEYPDLFGILDNFVRPVRQVAKNKKNPLMYNEWWRYWRQREELYRALRQKEGAFVVCRVSPHLAVARMDANMVFADSLVVFVFDTFGPFASLQSRLHEIWARFFSSSMKDDLRYAPSDCFETFPFPPRFETDPELESAGQAYHDFRAALMVDRDEGLTKIYNRFHDAGETAPDIIRLRELHAAMDHAVLRAYGWEDLIAAAQPVFLDETNEDDFTYQGRFFWPAAVRDEVLGRLLALNAERAAEEVELDLTFEAVGSEEDDHELDDVEGDA